jgi:choline kinase
LRVIVLAAGQGYQLDGFNKLLIKHPIDGKCIVERYLEAFKGKNITFVVGYRAINVMHSYPRLDYVYNDSWAVTNNSYSLSLAISDEPCYVLSGDLLFNPELISKLDVSAPDLVVSQMRNNRTLSAINIAINKNQVINEAYQGKLKSVNHPEAVGIFKISNPKLLASWKRNCIEYGNLFVGQNIPFEEGIDVLSYDLLNFKIDEVNTVMDYMRLLKVKS